MPTERTVANRRPFEGVAVGAQMCYFWFRPLDGGSSERLSCMLCRVASAGVLCSLSTVQFQHADMDW